MFLGGFESFISIQSPLLKKRFALEALKPGAERRTTELGARMGIQQDDKHRGP